MSDRLASEVELAWNLDDNQLYVLLDAEISDFQQGELALQKKFQKGWGSHAIVEAGKNKFSELWQEVKDITCQVYSENIDLGGKDLVTVLVTAITAALGWTGIWVIALVTIAVRTSLNKLCQV